MDIKDVIAQLKGGSHDWKNFSNNKSALGYDSDVLNFLNYIGPNGASALGFNSDSLNYGGGAPANDKKALADWLDSQVASRAMTTFKLRVFYTPVAVVPASVNVTFFNMSFNTGTFNGSGDLVFTNAGGDTATIQSLTSFNGTRISIQTLFDLTKTEPFTVGFLRMRPKTQAQLDFPMDIQSNSQFGAGKSNSINPDDYVDPYQFQLLRVDVPMNINVSNKQGWTWTIDEDQTGSGVAMTLFIPKTLDPTKALNNSPMVRNLNDGADPTFYTPNVPSGEAMNQIKAIAGNDSVKQIIASGVNPQMGTSLIKNMMSGISSRQL